MVTDWIKDTKSKGQELMIDSLMIGIAIGRGELQCGEDILKAIQQLKNLKEQIDSSKRNPFDRDDLFKQFLQQKKQILELSSENDQKVEKPLHQDSKSKVKETKQSVKTTSKKATKEQIKASVPINVEEQAIEKRAQGVEGEEQGLAAESITGEQGMRPNKIVKQSTKAKGKGTTKNMKEGNEINEDSIYNEKEESQFGNKQEMDAETFESRAEKQKKKQTKNKQSTKPKEAKEDQINDQSKYDKNKEQEVIPEQVQNILVQEPINEQQIKKAKQKMNNSIQAVIEKSNN